MSDDEGVLPVQCPKCDAHQAAVQVASQTIVTVKCTVCSHSWAIESSQLPERIKSRIVAGSPRG